MQQVNRSLSQSYINQQRSHTRSDYCLLVCSLLLMTTVSCSTALVNVALLALALVVAGTSLWSAKVRTALWQINQQTWMIFVMLYVALHGVGIVYSVAAPAEFWGAFRKASLLLYLPILVYAHREKKTRQALWIAFILSLLVIAGYDTLRHMGWLISEATARAIKDRIFLGLFVSLGAFVVMHWTLAQTSKHKQYLGMSVAGFFSFFVLFINDGRSGHIIFIALASLLCIQRLKSPEQRRYAIFFFLGAVLLLAATNNPVKTRLMVLWTETSNFLSEPNSESSMGLRYTFLKNFATLGMAHPWIGWGTGALREVYYQATGVVGVDNPHSQMLYNFVQHGMMGLLVLFGFLGSVWKAAGRMPSFEKWICQGVTVAYLLGCVMNSWLRDFSGVVFFIAVASLLLPTARAQGSVIDTDAVSINNAEG